MRSGTITMFFLLLGACVDKNKGLTHMGGEPYTPELKPSVYMFFIPECPWALNYTRDFQLMADSLGKAFNFIPVIAGSDFTEREINLFLAKSGLTMPVFRDVDLLYCRKFGVEVSPQFIFTDKNEKVLYSGAFDNRVKHLGESLLRPDSLYLYAAIREWQQGKSISLRRTTAVGCYIESE